MVRKIKKREDLSPVEFAELFFGWKAFDYQIEPLNDMNSRVLMACGRQVGKTEMAAIRALYSAIMKSDQTVLILAPVQRQAQILFRRIKFFLNKNAQMPKDRKIPLSNMIERETQTVIEFTNGSALYCLPISDDGSNIRGFTANDITIDEAEMVKDEAWAATNPMLATTKGTLRLIGTPYGQNNKFYEWYAVAERKKECNMWDKSVHFSTYRFPSKVSPLIDDTYLEQEAERLPHMEYEQEYNAVFLETVGTLWTERLVNSVMKEDCPDRKFPIPQYRYYLGYDVARFGDDEAVGIILERRTSKEEDKYFIVNLFEMKGKSLDYQVKILKGLHKIWDFEKMVIDTTAVGGGITDPLKATNYPVEEFNFSIKSKQDAYFHTTRLLESGSLTLPIHRKLKKQMIEMKREERSDGFTKIYHPSKTGGDDYPTALVLATWGLKKRSLNLIFDRSDKMFLS